MEAQKKRAVNSNPGQGQPTRAQQEVLPASRCADGRCVWCFDFEPRRRRDGAGDRSAGFGGEPIRPDPPEKVPASCANFGMDRFRGRFICWGDVLPPGTGERRQEGVSSWSRS